MNVANMTSQFIRLRSLHVLLLGLGVGYLMGIAATPSTLVQAEVTEEPRREAFKAGGLGNEPILREIAATLVRIENRVERIEKTVVPPTVGKTGTGKSVPTKK